MSKEVLLDWFWYNMAQTSKGASVNGKPRDSKSRTEGSIPPAPAQNNFVYTIGVITVIPFEILPDWFSLENLCHFKVNPPSTGIT